MSDTNYNNNETKDLTDEKFSLPDMGDYLDNEILQQISKKLMEDGNADPIFYLENPFTINNGYYPTENVFVFSASPQDLKEQMSMGIMDGDTVYFDYNTVSTDDSSFEIDDKKYKNVKDYLSKHREFGSPDVDRIGLRLLGFDAPEIVHYQTIPKTSLSKKHTIKRSKLLDAYKKGPNTLVDIDGKKYPISAIAFKLQGKSENVDILVTEIKKEDVKDVDEEKAKYVFEIDTTSTNSYKTVFSDKTDITKEGYSEDAEKATKIVLDCLSKAKDTKIIVDRTILNRTKSEVPEEYRNMYDYNLIRATYNPIYTIKKMYEFLTGNGEPTEIRYQDFGKDIYHRLLGSLFVKMDVDGKDLWVNVGKKVLAETKYSKALPQFGKSPSEIDKFGNASDVFRLWSYDKDNYLDVDSWMALEEKRRDDRKEIQKKITGLNLDDLKEYTCLIGDCLFLVPPTSIRSISTSVNEKVPLIRAKNSSVKSIPKSIREIEIDLFFNDDRGINGIPYEQITPSGSKETYYMNGLRALIAQFKFTPYLPIENNYINRVLNIDAVCLKDFMITTVPNFPKTLQVKIILKEFSYRHYMPELPIPDVTKGQDIYTNMFATTINFPVMRYYYQKCIREGERLHEFDFLSEEYIRSTFGNKTALQPMDFSNQSLKIYLANEEHLKQKQQLKEKLKSTPVNRTFKPSDDIINWLNQVSLAFQSLVNLIDTDYKNFKYKIENNKKYAVISQQGKTDFYNINSNEFPLFSIDKNKLEDLTNGGLFSKETTKLRKSCYNDTKKLVDNTINALKKSPVVDSVKVYNQSQTREGFKFLIEVRLSSNLIDNATNFELMRKYVAKILSIHSNEVLIDNKLTLEFSSKATSITTDSGASFPVAYNFDMQSNQDYQVFAILTQLAGDKKINLDGNAQNAVSMLIKDTNIESELENLKEALDLETLDSLRFDEYPIGFPLISNLTCNYSNLFAGVSLQAVDGEAPQYLGGSDISLEISLSTTNDFTVNQFYALQRVCVQRLLDYKLVMTCSPIKIDCEFTRMLGINEILIEDVDIQTVPSFPGLRQINLKVCSVDRTIRNREALQKLDRDEGLENTHSATIQTRNIFQLNDTLSKVDLYPDLELPTVLELDKKGFSFIKYRNEYGRRFVDPDFYFVYGYIYSSSMIRKAIVSYFSDPSNAERMFELSGGGEIKDTIIFKAYNATRRKVGKTRFSYNNIGKDGESNEIDINTVMKKNEEYIKHLIGSDKVYNENKEMLKDEIGTQLYKVENMLDIMTEFNEVISIAGGSHACIAKDVKIPLNDKEISESYSLYENSVKEKREADMKILKNDILHILSQPIKPLNKMAKLTDLQMENQDFITTNVTFNDFGKDCIKYTMKKRYDNIIKTIGKIFNMTNFSIDYNTISNIVICSMNAMTGKAPMFIDRNKNNQIFMKNNLDIPKVNVTINDKNNKIKTMPYILAEKHGQGESTLNQISDMKDAKNGIIFGPYAIKRYSSSYVQKFYDKPITNNELVFLDPYYNKEISKQFLHDNNWSNDRIDEYIQNISNSLSGCSHAFFRLMLLNLYKLLEDKTYLPLSLYMFEEIEKLIFEFTKYEDGFFDNITDFFDKTSFGDDITKLIKQVKGKDAVDDEIQKEQEEKYLKEKEKIKKEKEEKNKKDADKNKDEKESPKEKQVMEYDDLNLSFKNEADLIDKKNAIIKRFKALVEKVKNEDLIELKKKLINGMFALTAYMALEDLGGEKRIYAFAKNGQVSELEAYLNQLAHRDDFSKLEENEKRFHLLTSSLIGEYNETRQHMYTNGIEEMATSNKHTRIYLEAADDPFKWICHSYYDMIMTDFRGRMLRAFPTYYMLLIDEGREFGFWKLHDNFYNMNSIVSMEVTKSRKVAADTAIISMTNLYGTYTTEDEDIREEDNISFKEVFFSIFSPKYAATVQEQIRINAREINRANIVAGTRIHLRMGYGSNAARLPILFNGNVAEVQPGEVITLIAQGDGVELSNPSMFNNVKTEYIEDLQYDERIKGIRGYKQMFDNHITPRDMLISPFVYEGTWGKQLVRDTSKGLFFTENPFGIYHFGDPYFDRIFADCGEVGQNIYEALTKPAWSDDIPPYSNESHFAVSTAPKIRTSIKDKSYWDIMHMCASISPDFITSIVPFGMRSTVFYGHPRYYYAYDYVQKDNKEIVEKRKPFQQYHIITSFSDIISNNIVTSTKEIRTCATGHYKGKGNFSNKVKSVGPLYVDIDIYPEFQKMMTVDCGFEYNGTGTPITTWFADYCMDEWSSNGGYQIGWRATASALKNSVKDMYTGFLTIMGSASIKPYDKIAVHDVYANMSGNVEVEAVVHSLSQDAGFTTTIVPDAIATIDDRYEQVADLNFSEMIKPVLATHTVTCILLGKYLNSTKPQLLAASHAVKNFGSKAQEQIHKLSETIGKEEIANHSNLIDKLQQAVDKGFGLSDYDTTMYSLFQNILKNKNKLISFNLEDIKNQKDVLRLLNQLDSIGDTIDNLDHNSLISNFEKEIMNIKTNNSSIYKNNEALLEGTLNELKNMNVSIDKSDLKFSKKALNDFVKAVPKEKISDVEDLAKTVKELENFLDGASSEISYSEIKKQLKNIKDASIYIDDVKKIEGLLGDGIKNLDSVKDAYKAYDTLADTYKSIAGVTQAGKFGFITKNPFLKSIVGNIVFFLIETSIMKSAQTWVERYLQDLQVLTIHPLMRNGYVYTAGLNGHKGLVVGSPTYDKVGFFEEYAMKIFGDEPMETSTGKIFKFLMNVFFSTEKMSEIVSTYKKDNGYGVEANFSNKESVRADLQNKLADNIAYFQTKEFSIYKAMFLKNRIKSSGTKEWNNAYFNSKITGVQDIENDYKIDENLDLITSMDKVKFLKENNLFLIANEIAAENSRSSSIKKVSILKKSGGCYNVTSNYDSINNIWDIPMLRPDACIVLNMLVDKIAKKIEPSVYEPGCEFLKMKNHPIIFHNGTRVNDEWYSTGYCFSIEVKDYENFSNIIKEMETEQKRFSRDGNDVFSIQKHENKKNCYKFFIHAEIK